MGAGNLHELKRFPGVIFLFLKGEGFRPPLCGGETFDFEGLAPSTIGTCPIFVFPKEKYIFYQGNMGVKPKPLR